ncbi:isochorismatase family protein [Rahnella sp. SAP-1]|uniref:Isochorismatase family protein n=1 Tax=Rouxiella aceris TaxID=2703884 RepID=A0A848MLY3_9GAMM|nr:isochorismatase family protein [Rouxiella aceris]NMP28060.1 isochorismatase family protein [Rouxiella aceris]
MSSQLSPRQALLVIDMQIGQCSVDPLPYLRENLLSNINQLIEHFHHTDLPVFFIRHAGPQGSPFAAGEKIWHLIPELNIDGERDILIDKSRASCFVETPLVGLLQQQQITDVVIVGMKTQYCVDTACRTAPAFGFNPILIADAHSCTNSQQLAAADIIAHHNACLHGPVARVMTTQDFCYPAAH